MGLRCNIDRRGKVARLIWGLLLLVAGCLILFTSALPTGSLKAWIGAVACFGGGAFALFEALVGWCAVRALGFKTPM
jgi:hypothetical protein